RLGSGSVAREKPGREPASGRSGPAVAKRFPSRRWSDGGGADRDRTGPLARERAPRVSLSGGFAPVPPTRAPVRSISTRADGGLSLDSAEVVLVELTGIEPAPS